jgi:hypothetical protein
MILPQHAAGCTAGNVPPLQDPDLGWRFNTEKKDISFTHSSPSPPDGHKIIHIKNEM